MPASLDKIRKLGNAVYVDETSIERLGYVWLNQGYIAEAIEVFKLYAAAYPQSFNAYDNLGEAYMKNGDKQNAMINYRKSLQLNPENRNAGEMLKKLEKL